MIHSKNISIDLSRQYTGEVIRFHEGDVNGSALIIAITDNGEAFSLSGCTAKYDAIVGGHIAEINAAATISGNSITVPITTNMCAKSGLLKIDVKIIKNNDILFFRTIEAHVQRRVINEDAVIDDSGFTLGERVSNLEAKFPVNTKNIADGAVTLDKLNDDVTDYISDEVSENMGAYMLLPGSAPDDGNLWRQGQIGFVGGKPVIKTSSVGSFNYAVLATEAYVDTVLDAIADALAAI